MNLGETLVIVDQLEDPATVKGRIVKRGVTRILSPGTIIEPNLLKSNENNYYVGRQSADVSFVFRGISYAQDILMHAKTKKRGSWIAFSDNDSASTIIFFKK